jgi:hypothetical protein
MGIRCFLGKDVSGMAMALRVHGDRVSWCLVVGNLDGRLWLVDWIFCPFCSLEVFEHHRR